MKNQFKLFAFAMMTAASLVACSTDETTNSGSGEDVTLENGATLTGTLKGNTTLAKDGDYKLEGIVTVPDGITLKIEEGVELEAIDGDNVGYILVQQGGKIDAQGRAANPIVMTSEVKAPGSWGGLHICGKAPINSGIPSISEVGSSNYGGSDPADNSGVIKYVRLEYTGYSYSDEQECNGISFYGVGNGTQVSYVQAYEGSDDGFEFFGGTVNISHAVSTNCSDDSFDWTDGWRGCAQFLVVEHDEATSLNAACDCFLECDNGKPSNASPMSHPTLANLTMYTKGSSKKDGIMLKAGTEISLYNSVIAGKDGAVVLMKGDDALSHYEDDKSVLKGLAIDTDNVRLKVEVKDADGNKTTSYETDATLDAKFATDNTLGNTIAIASRIATGYTAPSIATLPAVKNSNFTFKVVDYIGAIKDDNSDWTKGWTKTL